MEEGHQVLARQSQQQQITSANTVEISFNKDQARAVVYEVGQCLAILDTYGKRHDTLEIIAATLMRDLNDLPPDRVVWAISEWRAKHGTDMPKPKNLRDLIDPPVIFDKSVYIEASKVPAENRTAADWADIQRYRNHVNGDDKDDDQKLAEFRKDNEYLRTERITMKNENQRLHSRIRELEELLSAVNNEGSDNKYQRTIDYLRKTGATDADIEQFKKEQKEH